MESINLGPRPGWEPLIKEDMPATHSFVSGDQDPLRLRVVYYRDAADGQRRAKVWFGPHAEGPPGCAHGGSVAAVLDETMGGNCWGQGLQVVAGTLTITYRQLVPLREVYDVVTRIDHIDGRKVHATGELQDQLGQVLAEAHGVFILLRPETLARLPLES